jgi:hypothetical protein
MQCIAVRVSLAVVREIRRESYPSAHPRPPAKHGTRAHTAYPHPCLTIFTHQQPSLYATIFATITNSPTTGAIVLHYHHPPPSLYSGWRNENDLRFHFDHFPLPALPILVPVD